MTDELREALEPITLQDIRRCARGERLSAAVVLLAANRILEHRRLAAAVAAREPADVQKMQIAPEGWVLTPVEPDEGMHAALTALGSAMVPDPHERDQWCWFAVKAFRAMLAARPAVVLGGGLQKMQISPEAVVVPVGEGKQGLSASCTVRDAIPQEVRPDGPRSAGGEA